MTLEMDRRDFLKSSGALIVSAGAGGVLTSAFLDLASRRLPRGRARTWSRWTPGRRAKRRHCVERQSITARACHRARATVAGADVNAPGQCLMGDTISTCNQGGASASTGVRSGGNPLRNAAAEARRLIVAAGAEKLAVPADSLVTENGASR
jgi:hypothetical protein